MNEEVIKGFRAGIAAIRGARDECETIAVYLENLIGIYAGSPEAANEAFPEYMNIIGDELNHTLRFIFNVFVPLTDIEPDTDGIGGDA